jgi:hypothetical protein
LLDHLLVTQPRLVLPLGLTATASCLEVTLQWRPKNLAGVVGVALEWTPAWGSCWILPLYHPSPANGGRWPRNGQHLQEFLAAHPGEDLLATGAGDNRPHHGVDNSSGSTARSRPIMTGSAGNIFLGATLRRPV